MKWLFGAGRGSNNRNAGYEKSLQKNALQ